MSNSPTNVSALAMLGFFGLSSSNATLLLPPLKPDV